MGKRYPREWSIARLDEVSTITDCEHKTATTCEEKTEWAYIRSSNIGMGTLHIDEGEYITKKTYQEWTKRGEPEEGDIILTREAPIGHVAMVPDSPNIALGQRMVLLTAKANIDSHFMLYALLSSNVQNEILRRSLGTTAKRINVNEIEEVEIPLPPRPEQKRIAEILSTVDEAIQQTDEVIEGAQRLKRGVMQDLVTKGIGHTEFKEVRIGPRVFSIPDDWSVKKLSRISKIIMGQSPPGSSYNDEGVGKPFFQGNADFGDMYPVVTQWTTQPSKMASAGDTLISVRAPVGAINMASIDCCIGRGLAAVRSKDNNEEKFLYYLLRNQSRFLESYAQGSTFESINKDVLVNLEVPLPPHPEQVQITNILSTTDDFIREEKTFRNRLQKLKRGLMQDLLTGKVRVKPDGG